ncbi:hypothetical protein [Corallococcus carmarthensis]|uniref:Uncharacterized protein n=1 Tax=Corallococcus carmarthensis TaxID=2316728 RepID=A0A3A8KGF8_9BACT|nr:hypothetical protein [Corallococcus carmarthensis]RKH06616.1 hypothetical protein D7X32_04205 [Corallococcus carmarthensis]
MKRSSRTQSRTVQRPAGPSSVPDASPRLLGEKLRAYLSTGAAGLGVSLEPSECLAVLNAIGHARQAGPLTPSGTDTDAVTAFRRSLPLVPGCAVCSASTMGGQPPMACWQHALPAAVNEAARLRQQIEDVHALVRALADTFGERKAVPGQLLRTLDVQVQAFRDNGGAL